MAVQKPGKAQQWVIEAMLRQIKDPARRKFAESMVFETKGSMAAKDVVRAMLGGGTAATVAAAANPAMPVALGAATALLLYSKHVERADVMNEYVKAFGFTAPMLSPKNMAVALAIREIDRDASPPQNVQLPSVRRALEQRRVLDLRYAPKAGKAFAPRLSIKELRQLGITRTGKLLLLEELKRLGRSRDVGKYRFATMRTIKKKLR